LRRGNLSLIGQLTPLMIARNLGVLGGFIGWWIGWRGVVRISAGRYGRPGTTRNLTVKGAVWNVPPDPDCSRCGIGLEGPAEKGSPALFHAGPIGFGSPSAGRNLSGSFVGSAAVG
jgi:hypothetical protein